MSMIEDTRKLLQDVVSPDFKALNGRVDNLTQRVDALEKSMREGFAASAANLEEGLATSASTLDRRMKEAAESAERIAALNEKVSAARHELLVLRFDQAVSELRNALNLDRRIERMERASMAFEKAAPATDAEPLSLPKSA